jgi:uncharacterized protein YaiI (UPF0178 family)
MMKILVDADACPVKEEIYRVARRYELDVILVTGTRMRAPEHRRVTLKIVSQGMNSADDWIAENAGSNDIVITGDIPLAARGLAKGAYVLGHSGRPFTEENIGNALATRALLSELRETGEVMGGPPPFSKRDRSRFLQELDRIINQIRRSSGHEVKA